MPLIPVKYAPKNLTKKDKKKAIKELRKSRKLYKKGKYHTRKKVKSFKSKVSPHVKKAMKMYKVDKVRPSQELAKKTKCSVTGLRKIVKKGQGAYYSSGSRPNQTGHSWGYARLGSAITGGKSSAVDYNILEKYCKKDSKALKLAKKMKKTYKYGKRGKHIKLGGGKNKTKKKKKKPRKWSRKYKLSINCKNPKGFSQKQYCKYGRKKGGVITRTPVTRPASSPTPFFHVPPSNQLTHNDLITQVINRRNRRRNLLNPSIRRSHTIQRYRNNLIRNNGYWVERLAGQFDDGYGNPVVSPYINVPCCSPCKKHGVCNRMFGCGNNQCYPCDEMSNPNYEQGLKICHKD